MLPSSYALKNCSIARALEDVGERWTLLIVRDLLVRPSRFGELERGLGIAKNILAARLAKLAAAGIVTQEDGDRARYALTRRGRDLFPVIAALMRWGDTYHAPDGPPVVIEHGCGATGSPRATCAQCGEEIGIGDVRLRTGPGFVPDPAARYGPRSSAPGA